MSSGLPPYAAAIASGTAPKTIRDAQDHLMGTARKRCTRAEISHSAMMFAAAVLREYGDGFSTAAEELELLASPLRRAP
jgi:hypothetical protein